MGGDKRMQTQQVEFDTGVDNFCKDSARGCATVSTLNVTGGFVMGPSSSDTFRNAKAKCFSAPAPSSCSTTAGTRITGLPSHYSAVSSAPGVVDLSKTVTECEVTFRKFAHLASDATAAPAQSLCQTALDDKYKKPVYNVAYDSSSRMRYSKNASSTKTILVSSDKVNDLAIRLKSDNPMARFGHCRSVERKGLINELYDNNPTVLTYAQNHNYFTAKNGSQSTPSALELNEKVAKYTVADGPGYRVFKESVPTSRVVLDRRTLWPQELSGHIDTVQARCEASEDTHCSSPLPGSVDDRVKCPRKFYICPGQEEAYLNDAKRRNMEVQTQEGNIGSPSEWQPEYVDVMPVWLINRKNQNVANEFFANSATSPPPT